MYAQDMAISAMQPCENNELVARPDVSKSLAHILVEYEPRLRRAFVGLPGRNVDVGQRRFNNAHDRHFDVAHVDSRALQRRWNRVGAGSAPSRASRRSLIGSPPP